MKILTRQEMFDKVWNHFVVNKAPRSVSPDGESCLYEGPKGAMCAVGVLLTRDMRRDLKRHDINDRDVRHICNANKYIDSRLDYNSNSNFLEDLQILHDEESSFAALKHRKKSLKDFAADWDLKVPKAVK